MQIYRATLELLDYVFYATVERGKIYETGRFIHNYALTYALHLADAGPYAHRQQEPHYEDELARLKDVVYLTPATPGQVSHRLVQWNTVRESYALPGKSLSIGYPDWGFARVLRPESTFTFYALVADANRLPSAPAFHSALVGGKVHIRLGKFLGKALVTMEPATSIEEGHGTFVSQTLLNWRDLPAIPEVCDVLAASLPTRLLDNARFIDADFYTARFGDDAISFPVGMHFLLRPA